MVFGVGFDLSSQSRPNREYALVDEDDAPMPPLSLKSAKDIDEHGIPWREKPGGKDNRILEANAELLLVPNRIRAQPRSGGA